MKVTLQNIAKELNVSPATVSRSLRDDPSIHPATRTRINEMAQLLGYRGSSGRQPQREKKPERQALGLLLSQESLTPSHPDVNLVQMMDGVMAEADRRGFLLNVHAIRSDEEQRMATHPQAVPALIRDDVCQALIVRGPHDMGDVAFLTRQMPVVSLVRPYPGLHLDTVLSNDVEGVRTLVARLVEAGHGRLVWVGGHTANYFFEARQAGFVMGCLSSGLAPERHRSFGPEIFENRRILDASGIVEAVRAGATAVLCGNDFIALQVIATLENVGFRVPQDVSVTGFDGASALSAEQRHVTSIDPNFFEMGRAAVRLVMQRLTDPTLPPQTLVVASALVPGETMAPASKSPRQ